MRRGWLIGGLLALAACGGGDGGGGGGGTQPPQPGTLTLTLQSPNGNDGAVMFTLRGAQIDTVTVASGYRMFLSRVSQNNVRVIVTGTIAGGPIVRFNVPDVNQASTYFAFVEQAAVRGTYQQQEVTNYRLLVSK